MPTDVNEPGEAGRTTEPLAVLTGVKLLTTGEGVAGTTVTVLWKATAGLARKIVDGLTGVNETVLIVLAVFG